MNPKLSFLDLFCGIGGIRLAMEQAGFSCLFSCDLDAECRKTYEDNFGEVPAGDIREISAEEIPDADVLCAGFPCQPFSVSGKQLGFSDTRGTLFFEICRILEAKKPEAFLLENVKQLKYHDGGRTLSIMLSCLSGLGYSVSWQILNAADFGVPQNRERIFLVGSLQKSFDFSGIRKQKRTDIRSILDTEGDFSYLSPEEYTLVPCPVRKEKSGLIFAGYRNRPMRKAGVRPATEYLSRSHHQCDRIYSVYGTHPTLSSQETSGRYFILTEEEQVRKLTLTECRRLMGFRENFRFPVSKSEQYRQLGNSVCVPVARAVAEDMKSQFFSRSEEKI